VTEGSALVDVVYAYTTLTKKCCGTIHETLKKKSQSLRHQVSRLFTSVYSFTKCHFFLIHKVSRGMSTYSLCVRDENKSEV
jgi:hypothetical protein